VSPEVWDDALPRIQAAAASIALSVELPNEDAGPRPMPPAPWLDIEVAAQGAEPIEIGGKIWEERGQIFLHVMIPVGTGLRAGLVLRKTLSEAFRAVTDAPAGLVYRDGQDFDPLGPGTDDGVYRRLSLVVRYIYQDTT
jgi:Bacteriophage related domain of unknown function